MSYDRQSPLVRAGRTLQKGVWALRPLDPLIAPFFPRKEKDDPYGILVILAPPRSGSTLTYQLLRSGIRGSYLSNLQNLFYANPVLGYALSRGNCQGTVSGFRSSNGFVPGKCGESEGAKFWEYWIGQGLDEKADEAVPRRAEGLPSSVARMNQDRRGPFINGYLGHVFSIRTLRQLFPKVHFIHLKRDLLSNAVSLYNYAPDSWKSTKPLGYREHLYRPREEQVAEQLFGIHQKILEQDDEAWNDMYELHYESLCQDPHGTLKNIREWIAERASIPKLLNQEQIPGSFRYERKDPENPQNIRLQEALEKRYTTLDEESKRSFAPIFRPRGSSMNR